MALKLSWTKFTIKTRTSPSLLITEFISWKIWDKDYSTLKQEITVKDTEEEDIDLLDMEVVETIGRNNITNSGKMSKTNAEISKCGNKKRKLLKKWERKCPKKNGESK